MMNNINNKIIDDKQDLKEKKNNKSRLGIISELIIGLIFLIPALIMSFDGSIEQILGVLAFITSLIMTRGSQLYFFNNPKKKYKKRLGILLALGFLVLILGIISCILIDNFSDISYFGLLLAICGVIIGFHAWILFLFLPPIISEFGKIKKIVK